MAIGEWLEIVRFCGTPKDKERIMSRVGLNDVQADSYLDILIQQSMIKHNDGKYVVTSKGKGYVSSSDKIRKLSI